MVTNFKVFALALMAVLLVGCGYVTVPAGQEAVLTAKPAIFGHGGVIAEAVKPGREIVAATTDETMVVMTPITFDEEFNDIMPKDNNPVDYHAAVRLQITDSVKIVSKFGLEWYKNNVQRPFQTMNRQIVRKYSMPELALQQEVVADVEKYLTDELTKHMKDSDLPVKVFPVTIGRVSPQKEITDAYNETGVQQQRSKTEAQRALAETQRKAAETNRALADRAYQDTLGLTSEQYIRLQQIKMCGEKPNCTVFLGATPTPMLAVK